MKVVVSFHKVDGKLYDSIKDFFYPNPEVEIYGRNLTNHFKQGPHELFANPVKLNDRLSSPDLALVLLSKQYLMSKDDDWLSKELDALINLERHRNEQGKLVLITLTSDITFTRHQSALKNRVSQTIDFRVNREAGMQALISHILDVARRKRLETENSFNTTPKPSISDQLTPTRMRDINLHGPNSRVNINSPDGSINRSYQFTEIFAPMRQAIRNGVQNSEERAMILDKLSELENAKGKPSFIDKYREFMATAANHVETIAPFLPALSQMLGS